MVAQGLAQGLGGGGDGGEGVTTAEAHFAGNCWVIDTEIRSLGVPLSLSLGPRLSDAWWDPPRPCRGNSDGLSVPWIVAVSLARPFLARC